MVRMTKDAKGKYHIHGKTFSELVGTRAQVWHGTAYKTSGDLTKPHLFKNKSGRIVSKKKHLTAKKEKRLVKHGYGSRKGHFGFVALSPRSSKSQKHTRRHKKRRGGMPPSLEYATSFPAMSGDVGTSGANLQLMATQY